MDAKSFGKMTRGKLRPEGRIDLHGMTMAEAHPALQDFILGSAQLQRRLVLVITGKGKSKPDHGPIPERHGVLRHNVPIWLRQSPLSAVILEVTPAPSAPRWGRGVLCLFASQGSLDHKAVAYTSHTDPHHHRREAKKYRNRNILSIKRYIVI